MSDCNAKCNSSNLCQGTYVITSHLFSFKFGICLFVCLCGDTKAKRDSSPGSIPMLSSQTRLVNLTVTLSTQEYKWVPVSFPQKVRRTGG